MTAYYNDIDPFSCDWTRQLIKAGIIPDGEVDERSIWDVRPDDLTSFQQCHFCNGISVWPYVLKQAGFPTDRVVWTGSMPCQPFSAAGKREGFADERHLWPAWFHLIGVCKPPVVFGEQVAGKDGGTWLDLVHADLESMGYACGPVVAPAAGFGSPQGRHRIYLVADTTHSHGRPGERGTETGTREDGERRRRPASSGTVGVVGKSDSPGSQPGRETCKAVGHGHTAESTGGPSFLVHTLQQGLEGYAGDERNGNEPGRQRKDEARPVAPASGPCNSFWSDALWIPCRDGKWRPIEPGTSPLASGLPRSMGSMQPELRRLAEMAGLHGRSLKRAKGNRTGRLKGYGNCIVAPQAEAFVRAYMDYLR